MGRDANPRGVHRWESILAVMQAKKVGSKGTYHTRLLAAADLRDLQRLFERCRDYFEVATGAPAGSDEATRAFVAGPPTKSVDDKRVIGVFDGREGLIGVLDSLIDWPDQHVWTMGMLLLDPEHRGTGLGTWVLQSYEEWAGENGARGLRTAVVSHHLTGIQFLEHHGYSLDSTIEGYDAGARTATIGIWVKGVPTPS